MAGNEIFSTVLRGYKKEEVIGYIEDLNDQLQQLKTDLDRKEVEIDRLNKEIFDLHQLQEQQDEVSLEQERALMREEIEKELRAEFERKMDEQTALIEAKVAKQKDDGELQRKAKEYDECKDALADLMIQARKNADDIVAKAQAEAAMLKSRSQAEFSQLGASFSVLQQNVGNIRIDLRQKLDKISEQVDMFEEQLGALQEDVEQTIVGLSGSAE